MYIQMYMNMYQKKIVHVLVPVHVHVFVCTICAKSVVAT
jgi:hypothetical protein